MGDAVERMEKKRNQKGDMASGNTTECEMEGERKINGRLEKVHWRGGNEAVRKREVEGTMGARGTLGSVDVCECKIMSGSPIVFPGSRLTPHPFLLLSFPRFSSCAQISTSSKSCPSFPPQGQGCFFP